MDLISMASRAMFKQPEQHQPKTRPTYLDILIKRQQRVRHLMQLCILDNLHDKQVQAMYLLNAISNKISECTRY
jgi:hypothetical protein